jgi:hypothetical protein
LCTFLQLAQECLEDGSDGDGLAQSLRDMYALEFGDVCILYNRNKYFSHKKSA